MAQTCPLEKGVLAVQQEPELAEIIGDTFCLISQKIQIGVK